MAEAPRYPEIRVETASHNPLALVAAVRCAMRRAHLDPSEIDRFSEEALERSRDDSRRRVCASWVQVV